MIRVDDGRSVLEYELEGDSAVLTGFEGSDLVCFVPESITAGDKDYPVTTVAKKALLNSPFREISLPSCIRDIGDWAFSKSIHLKTFNVRGSLEDTGVIRLGKGILEGTTGLESVSFGYTEPDDLSFLTALCAGKLPAAFLLRTDNLGTKEWYESFDASLEAFLKEEDDATFLPDILCGEEDISYDGVGMVDGEMPGETPAYIRKKREEKAAVCLTRLLRATGMAEDKRVSFSEYVKEHSLGTKDPSAWEAIKHELNMDMEYVKVYCDVTNPDKSMRDRMLRDMGKSGPEVKAFLLAGADDGTDFFDELRL
ncbi:MAG: leucine-rich repeat domain-containing protein [Lachnospiraceae bacterium]|nr:leucine-rich repeat domain-containing protein [Lachnospiraceae bacterium]